MSAIIGRGTKVPFGAPTSLIFLYALSLFFFKQRLLMWRIAQLAHELDNFTPDLNVPYFESHKSPCKFSVQLNRHDAEVDFKAFEKL